MVRADMKKILMTNPNYMLLLGHEAKMMLEEHGFTVVGNTSNEPLKREKLLELVTDVYGIIAGVENFDEEVFKAAKNLRIIARYGVGVDNIDIEKAKKYGIAVTNTKGANANGVAEHTVALIFALLRNIPVLNEEVKKGIWSRYEAKEITGSLVGFIGFGEIARLAAKKLCGFDVKLYAYDKYPDKKAADELEVKYASFDYILTNCDIISLHLPYTPETYRIIGENEFKEMKKGALFINTSRGQLVDEMALYHALVSGRLGGAAIDVYEKEPVDPDNPLLKLNNIICTPHIAGSTRQNHEKAGLMVAQAIIDFMEGRTPKNLLP